MRGVEPDLQRHGGEISLSEAHPDRFRPLYEGNLIGARCLQIKVIVEFIELCVRLKNSSSSFFSPNYTLSYVNYSKVRIIRDSSEMNINLKDIYLITRSRRFHNRSDIVAKRNCLDRVLQFGREGMSENSFIIRDIHRIRGENLEPPQFACIGTGNVLRDLFETVRSE